jgi:hypothetical protein
MTIKFAVIWFYSIYNVSDFKYNPTLLEGLLALAANTNHVLLCSMD